MLIGIIIKANYMIIGNLSAISEKPYITTISFLPGILLNISGNIIFVPIYGVEAAIITTIASYFFITITLYLLLYKDKIYIGYQSLCISFCMSLLIYLTY